MKLDLVLDISFSSKKILVNGIYDIENW